MAKISLGAVPHTLVVNVAADADFYQTISRSDGLAWDLEVDIALKFLPANSDTPILWRASISGLNAVFDVDFVDVNVMIAAKPRRVLLTYTENDVEQVWAVGRVQYDA